MKYFLSFAILATLLTAVHGQADPWKEYKKQHGKDYKASKDGGKEDARRKELFLATDARITKHNSQKNVTYQLEHNQFSDMTPDELKKYVGAVMPANTTRSLESIITIDMTDRQLPGSLDYRASNCLPAVKNQGSCGCCWAFAAITPLEFAQCTKSGSPVILSEQQLVDCDTINKGCSGGWYTDAWNYLKSGSAKQSSYPYTTTQSTCQFSAPMVEAQVASYGYISTPNAINMQKALQKYGPLSVAIAVVNSFYSYKSGVYSDKVCNNRPVNHAVNIVGYGTQNGLDYWVVRNSWGTGWGSGGYILMQRGVNICSIEMYPAFVGPVF